MSNTSGAPVRGATITVTSVDQGFARNVKTDKDGSYNVPQLPIGKYKVKIVAPGFSAYDDEVALNLGTSSYNFSLDLKASNDANVETVVVRGTKQQIKDFDRTTTGLTIDVSEITQNIPVSRSLNDLITLAPSTAKSDGYWGALNSMGGGAVNENVYYLNGFDITDSRSYLGGATIPFEFYNTVEVKTSGWASEFGRATGGAVNTISKSGSNDFHTGVTAYWSPSALHATSPNDYNYENRKQVTGSSSENVYFSGPLIKDHLFYYALVNFNQSRNQYNTWDVGDNVYPYKSTDGTPATQYTVKNNSPFYAIKLDGYINENHHIEYTRFDNHAIQYTSAKTYDSDTGTFSTDNGSTRKNTGGPTDIIRYTGVLTDWLTISGLWGHQHSNNRTTGSSGASCPIVYVYGTSSTGTRKGCWTASTLTTGGDARTEYRFDADLYFHLLGEHHARVGYDIERLVEDYDYGYSGGAYYQYKTTASTASLTTDNGKVSLAAGTDYVRKIVYAQQGKFSTLNSALYAQDAWKIPELGLSIFGGLRWDRFQNRNYEGVTFIKMNNQVAPRVGATYDLFGDGNTKLSAFFGQYYLPIANNTNARQAGYNPYYWTYYYYTGIDSTTYAPTGLTEIGTYTSSEATRPVWELSAKNLKPMREDEYTVGFDHTFSSNDGRFGVFDKWLDGWNFGLHGTYRNLASVIEDTELDGPLLKYCADHGISGCDSVWGSSVAWTLINPGSKVVFQTKNLPGTNGALTTITLTPEEMGLPKATRDYKSIELTMNRPFDGEWGFDGSYTWVRSYGNYEGGVKSDIGQSDTGLTQDFDTITSVLGAKGDLPNGREHTFKLHGTYSPIQNLLIGLSVTVQSPRKFGCIGDSPDDYNGADYTSATTSSSSSWFCPTTTKGITAYGYDSSGTVAYTPRGTQFESDWLSQVDLNFNYLIPQPYEDVKTVLTLSIFNLFNSHAGTEYNEYGDLGGHQADPHYAEKTGWQTPRYVRMGIEIRY
ncbi:MAG: carboxypeptidase regulatory-like domain-containing protein [Rhizomicrobium sp.]